MAGLVRNRTFFENLHRSLLSEGYKERQILRTFPEVLMVAHDKYAETCWTDPTGALIHGPIEGFGPGKT